MKAIASAENIKIYCSTSGRYSFFNSPYPAHKQLSGIDIYSSDNFGEVMPSPVSGTVINIRKVKAPKGHGFKDAGYDIVIILESSENPSKSIKLLHIEPNVSVGDSIKAGDIIGKTLRSGYYGYATSPHVHVEIRDPSDPLRARGGYELTHTGSIGSLSKSDSFIGKVVIAINDYTLLRLSRKNPGLVGTIGEVHGIIDGGIPYYGWLGFHTNEPTHGDLIKLQGIPIGKVERSSEKVCIGRSLNYQFKANKEPIRGLSLYLTPNNEEIVKIIHLKRGESSFKAGDEVEIEISPV